MNIQIASITVTRIKAYQTDFLFDKTNVRRAHCADCGGELLPGIGIARLAYKHNGFLCFACFAHGLIILTHAVGRPENDSGFVVDKFFGNLRACTFDKPAFSTLEVIEAVYRALLDGAYTSIEILLGAEGAGIFKISDAAESFVGAM